ncbi:MAG: hypothetical protein HZA27_05205 [Candidatus Omnitrophica bacterium]|nr:hypothetical protein [Candidatus Omnitrophota bacterium]
MKKLLLVIGYGLLAVLLAGCARGRQSIKPAAPVESVASLTALPEFSGPKARITLADFELNVVKAKSEIASGLRQMCTTLLVNTNRFSVLERQGDLIITASVTEFAPQASGGRAGLGGGGGAGSGILGGLLGAVLNKAQVALEIRIIDAATSEVLSTTRVEGQASDTSGKIMTDLSGKWGLGSDLSIYAHTPMEKAIRICVIEAVRYIAQAIPPNYYKYESGSS